MALFFGILDASFCGCSHAEGLISFFFFSLWHRRILGGKLTTETKRHVQREGVQIYCPAKEIEVKNRVCLQEIILESFQEVQIDLKFFKLFD